MAMAQEIKSSLRKIDNFYGWKKDLVEHIDAYCDWLSNTQMASEDMVTRLSKASRALNDDELTVAFVGEFSRGKSELINALLFSDHGQRVLPSKAGRTTMCPTELFYDRQTQSTYMRLLPIESRRLNLTITEMKSKPNLWERFDIDFSDPERLANELMRVADVVSVTVAEAQALGFEESALEQDPKREGMVLIPKWRHAEMSLDHPLLQQGLRILDTPGLNALGSEPELTVSMIPNAQAVIFMLSADAGVTASDMAIWDEYIVRENKQPENCFALLNKVDVLWDDIQGETHTAASIDRVRRDTARRLNIDFEFVLPVSAKKALSGKVNKDAALTKRSGLPKFERLLSDQLVDAREKLLHDSSISDVTKLVESSEKVIDHRIARAESDLVRHRESVEDTDSLKDMADRTQADHTDFYKRLVALRSSRRLMLSQKKVLEDMLSMQRFDAMTDAVSKAMKEAWSTRGLIKAMAVFFEDLDHLLDNLMVEIRVAEKMVDTMYSRFKHDHQAAHLHPTGFSARKYRKRIADLRANFEKYRRRPALLVTEQTLVIRHFKNAFMRDAKEMYEQLHNDATSWADEALLPLMQYTVEQKQGLQSQLDNLRVLARDHKSKREACDFMESVIENLRMQKDFTHRISEQLHARP